MAASDLGIPGAYQPLDSDVCPACGQRMAYDAKNGQKVCHGCGESQGISFMVGAPSYGPNAMGGVGPAGGSNGARRLTTYMYNGARTTPGPPQPRAGQGVECDQTVHRRGGRMRAAEGADRLGRPPHHHHQDPSILKKLKLQKYYNHVFAITARLSGRAAPQLSTLQEEKLLAMFQMVQEPFQRHCPPDRTNMISYSYVLRKLVEILGWHSLVDYFPLLKSRHKVYLRTRSGRKSATTWAFTSQIHSVMHRNAWIRKKKWRAH